MTNHSVASSGTLIPGIYTTLVLSNTKNMLEVGQSTHMYSVYIHCTTLSALALCCDYSLILLLVNEDVYIQCCHKLWLRYYILEHTCR